MTEYETIYITPANIDEQSSAAIADKVKASFNSDDAQMIQFKDWGVKKLTYEIAKTRRGHYFLVNYMAKSGDTVNEIERNFRLNENVIRFLTVKLGEVTDVAARLQNAQPTAEAAEAQA
mgnify:CR=1 FL=1